MVEKLRIGNMDGGAKRIFGTGIVIWRKRGFKNEVVLLYSAKTETWHLPKAMVKHDESPIESMIRKIPEMTGVRIKLGTKIGSVSAFVYRNDEVVPKATSYYIAEGISGEPECNGCEDYERIEYVSVEEALQKLDFDTIQEKERPILEKAIPIMK